MKLLVGLGNPGQKYENTRHNIGFRFLDERASWNQLWNWKFESKYKAEIIKGNIWWEQILLCKPQTYMNLSGEAVAPLARFYQIPPENILVLHDEIDFVTGRIALKLGWSAAGHNGLKSIIERPAVSSQVSDRVLSSFKPEEKKLLADKQSEIFSFIDEFLK